MAAEGSYQVESQLESELQLATRGDSTSSSSSNPFSLSSSSSFLLPLSRQISKIEVQQVKRMSNEDDTRTDNPMQGMQLIKGTAVVVDSNHLTSGLNEAVYNNNQIDIVYTCRFDCSKCVDSSHSSYLQLASSIERICEHAVVSKERIDLIINEEVFRTKFLAMALGNMMEWYDYIMFGSLADIIAEEFFPDSIDPRFAFIQSLALFGVAFLMRPFGGLLFGWIGDKVSRKCALEISLGMMMISSICIACLPSYHTFGYPMTVLLLIFRLIQGLSCGGETVGAFIYIIEATKGSDRGFWGACCKSTGILGCSIAVGVVSILRYTLSKDQLRSFGWRLAFLLGIIFGIIGLFLRQKLSESEESLASHHTDCAEEETAFNDDQEANFGTTISATNSATKANAKQSFNGKDRGGYNRIADSSPNLEGNPENPLEANRNNTKVNNSALAAATATSTIESLNGYTAVNKMEEYEVAPIVPSPSAEPVAGKLVAGQSNLHEKSLEPLNDVDSMDYWREIVLVFLICSFAGIVYYTYFVWMSFFMSRRDLIGNLRQERGPGGGKGGEGGSVRNKDGIEFSWLINCFTNLLYVFSLPLGGKLGDLIGFFIISNINPKSRSNYNVHASNNEGFRLAMLISLVLAILLALPSFFLILKGTLMGAISGSLIFVFILGIYTGNLPALINSVFDRRIRYSSVGVAYNVASAVFSGTAPLICTALVMSSQIEYLYGDDDAPIPPRHDRSVWIMLLHDGRLRPAYYVMASAIVALLAISLGIPYVVKRRRSIELQNKKRDGNHRNRGDHADGGDDDNGVDTKEVSNMQQGESKPVANAYAEFLSTVEIPVMVTAPPSYRMAGSGRLVNLNATTQRKLNLDDNNNQNNCGDMEKATYQKLSPLSPKSQFALNPKATEFVPRSPPSSPISKSGGIKYSSNNHNY